MTQATDTDIREIRTAVESIAKATEANTKAIAELILDIRLGFANVDLVRGFLKSHAVLTHFHGRVPPFVTS
jgi:hypothetical protein